MPRPIPTLTNLDTAPTRVNWQIGTKGAVGATRTDFNLSAAILKECLHAYARHRFSKSLGSAQNSGAIIPRVPCRFDCSCFFRVQTVQQDDIVTSPADVPFGPNGRLQR